MGNNSNRETNRLETLRAQSFTAAFLDQALYLRGFRSREQAGPAVIADVFAMIERYRDTFNAFFGGHDSPDSCARRIQNMEWDDVAGVRS